MASTRTDSLHAKLASQAVLGCRIMSQSTRIVAFEPQIAKEVVPLGRSTEQEPSCLRR